MTRLGVRIVGCEELSEIPGSWTSEDFRTLLDAMDYGDSASLSATELREMCVLSLQDREPAEAAALLLEHRLGGELVKGQIRNISHEMLDEKLWEEHPDMPLHERLFHVGSLLHLAFPDLVPLPDAVHVRLEVQADDEEGEELLAGSLQEAFLVRLLAAGMPESATLNRLFEDPLAGGPFPEAQSIVWTAAAEPVAARTVRLQLIGSGCWFDALRGTKSYEYRAR